MEINFNWLLIQGKIVPNKTGRIYLEIEEGARDLSSRYRLRHIVHMP